MKFKNYLTDDIEKFRKLNVGITNNSEDELVRKIEKKYNIKNEVIDLIEDMNKLLGKKKKIGFTYDLIESEKIEEELKNFNKRRIDVLKIKFFESNSFLSEMKRELEKKLMEM